MIKLVQNAQASFGPNYMNCHSKQQAHTGLNVRSLSLEQYTLLTVYVPRLYFTRLTN